MKTLLTFILCLIGLSSVAQVQPPFIRHGLTTNYPNSNQFSGNAIKNGVLTTNLNDAATITSAAVDTDSLIATDIEADGDFSLGAFSDGILNVNGNTVGLITVGSGLSYSGTTLSSSVGNGFPLTSDGNAAGFRITNSQSIQANVIYFNTNRNTYISNDLNGGLVFVISNAPYMYFKTTGSLPKLSINTNSTFDNFAVHGSASFGNGNAFTISASGISGVNGTFSITQVTGTASSPFRITDTNGDSMVHVRTNGVVIIGKTNNNALMISNNVTSGVSSLGSGTNAPSIFIATNGNVGIGTASPTARLEVVTNSTPFQIVDGDGVARMSFTVATATSSALTIGRNGGGSSAGVLNLYNSSGSTAQQLSGANWSGSSNSTITFDKAAQLGGNNASVISMPVPGTIQIITNLNVPIGSVGISTTTPGYKLHIAGDAYIPTNAAPFTVISNAPATLITNLNQRATLVVKLAFDDVTGGIPSCTIVSTNLLSTNYFGSLSPALSGLTLVGTVTITNDYSYPMQTNSIFKITDTSSGGAAVRVVQALVFEQ